MKNDSMISQFPSTPLGQPIIDGTLLTDEPLALWAAGKFKVNSSILYRIVPFFTVSNNYFDLFYLAIYIGVVMSYNLRTQPGLQVIVGINEGEGSLGSGDPYAAAVNHTNDYVITTLGELYNLDQVAGRSVTTQQYNFPSYWQYDQSETYVIRIFIQFSDHIECFKTISFMRVFLKNFPAKIKI
jgi:hypothetical protein